MKTTSWNIDPAHSGIHFTVRHMVVSKVRGSFGKFTGTRDYDAAAPERAKVKVSIDASSIDTNEPKRDEHLKSPDFFDVAKYPAITFESTGVLVGDKIEIELDIEAVAAAAQQAA